MYNYPISLIASLIALSLIVYSYFVKNKSKYLLFQFLGIIFLVLSYLFIEQYFAMISLSVGLARTVIFYVYEKNNKKAPLWWAIVISLVTIAVYYLVNIVILKEAKLFDLLCLTSLCLYAFVFRIRNLTMVRYCIIAPVSLSITYNVLISAPIFTTLSYVFELSANLLAIIKFEILDKRREKL